MLAAVDRQRRAGDEAPVLVDQESDPAQLASPNSYTGGTDQSRYGPYGDWLFGDAGDDQLYGSNRNDMLSGGAGADYILGGDGDDLIQAGGGNDLIYASQGGTDGERYQQEEGDGEHNRQREDTLPEPAPEVGPHAVDGFGLDFPDEILSSTDGR